MKSFRAEAVLPAPEQKHEKEKVRGHTEDRPETEYLLKHNNL